MSLQFSTIVRNAMLDSIQYGAGSGQITAIGVSAVLKVFTGAVPATCATADSGTKVAEFDLASSWAANAAAGAKSLSGMPLTIAAVAAGTLGYFRIYASDGVTCHMQGAITMTGGGGDLTVDNTNVTAGQHINITAFTLNAPGA
jgi:mono/diheme cytochrome c family protein